MNRLKITTVVVLLGMGLFACTKKEGTGQPNLFIPPPVTTPPTTEGGKTGFTVYQGINQGGEKVDLDTLVVYSSAGQSTDIYKPLPAGFNDNIKSFVLPKGYMATFSENQNGTGESLCYVAALSTIKENLPSKIAGKVSFVRFTPIKYTTKKGLGQQDATVIATLNGSWYYNWGLAAASTNTKTYVPMTWGKGATSTTNITGFMQRKDIDHLLAFNEPDNAKQSNITVQAAIESYKALLQTGLRIGSPAVEQNNSSGADKWLTDFMSAAATQHLRVDFIALHWYDWGNQTEQKATAQLTAEAVFERFKKYVEKLHAAYPDYNLWFTEFNCNPARGEDVHKIFMKLAANYLNQLPYVERYAYFFPTVVPPTSGAPGFALTAAGQAWNEIAAPSAYAANVIPK
ncbi:MAG TPA: glycosyl hydrolase [Pelobium sp.]